MAQWRRLVNLDPTSRGKVNRLYHDCKFPRDIRNCFSDWIEEQDWDSAAADDATARTLFQTLLLKLDEQIRKSNYNNDTLEGTDFSGLYYHVMSLFERCPMEMAEKLSHCLKEERVILDSLAVEQHGTSLMNEQSLPDLDDKVNKLKDQIKKIEEEIKVLEKMEQMFTPWENQVKQNEQASAEMQQQCFIQGNSIRTKKQELVDQVSSSVKLIDQIVQTLVSVELPKWKRGQQMSCIGNPVKTSLDQLEKWFTAVGEMMLELLQHLPKLQNNNTCNMSELLQHIYTCFLRLLQNALVVEEQPVTFSQKHRPLVLRTKVMFTVKLRFLANLPIIPKDGCSIKAEFDKDVEEVETIKGFRQFQFTSRDIKVMKTDKDKSSLVAEWDLEIMEMKCKRKRSNMTPIRVTEELHIIKFSTNLTVAGRQCKVETTSLPVVIVSTTTQSPSAWASIMWYNLLSVAQPTTLSVFKDPPPLSWEQLSPALSWQFISAGDRELNLDQLQELRLKVTDDGELVSWSKFSNKDGPWMWIDEILDLIEKHLKRLWKDGSIMGFVSKEKARALLQNSQSGNFLLRFSESKREGAVSFSWVEHRKQKAKVHDIDPFTKVELSKMSLVDVINKYRVSGRPSNPLLYLYPDIPKDEAFGRYYSTPETSKSVDPYLGKNFVCEGNYTTPPSPPSSPEHSQTEEDLMDFLNSELQRPNHYDVSDMSPSVHLYNDMDVDLNTVKCTH